jgi:hypothetical protein
MFYDDESAGTSSAILLERNSGVVESTVLVSITGGTAIAGGVDYDDSQFPLTVVFPVGELTAQVPLDIVQENLVELDETVTLDVVPVQNAALDDRTITTLAIRNDDSATFQVSSESGNEDDGPITFQVSLTNPVDVLTSVAVATADDTALLIDNDFQAVSALTLQFPAGVTEQTFEVRPNDDIKVEPDESFSVHLADTYDGGRSVTATSSPGEGVILNDDFLTGRVFDDRDNDGWFDSGDGDMGIGGVTVQLVDADTDTVVDTQVTAADGTYTFGVTVDAGTYNIVQVFDDPATAEIEDQLSRFGVLDGKETAGVNGGQVDHAQDHDQISGIVVGAVGPAGDSIEYLFGELLPSSLQGLVWEDFDNAGDVDLGELPIDNATITLTGYDDRGHLVTRSQLTGSEGIYEFADLRPGNYRVTEKQPVSLDGVETVFIDGQEVLGEVIEQDPPVPPVIVGQDGIADPDSVDPGTGEIIASSFSGIVLVAGSQGINYNFGERVEGGTAAAGQTAGIGFWQNNTGQQLLKSLNGSPDSTMLAAWLSNTFPNMYGSLGDADGNGIADDPVNNTYVADLYRQLFKRNAKTSPGGPPKLDAQVMAVALATYVTKQSFVVTDFATGMQDADLADQLQSYGFGVTVGGIGSTTFDVGDSGVAFGVANDSQVRIIDLLLATDAKSADGLLYDDLDQDGIGDGTIDDEEELMRILANDLYSAINELGSKCVH